MHLKGKSVYKYNFSYELIAMGNYSKLVKRGGQTYELTSYSNYRNLDKFNEALLAFMELFKELFDYILSNNELKKYIDSNEGKLEVYKVTKDGINNCSLKFDKEHPDTWTQCMKYLLTILKLYILMIIKHDKDYYKDILDKSIIINNNNA